MSLSNSFVKCIVGMFELQNIRRVSLWENIFWSPCGGELQKLDLWESSAPRGNIRRAAQLCRSVYLGLSGRPGRWLPLLWGGTEAEAALGWRYMYMSVQTGEHRRIFCSSKRHESITWDIGADMNNVKSENRLERVRDPTYILWSHHKRRSLI